MKWGVETLGPGRRARDSPYLLRSKNHGSVLVKMARSASYSLERRFKPQLSFFCLSDLRHTTKAG